MFYIYKRKSAIREFCDKYIRDKLKSLSPRKSWEKLKPITEIGIELGKINKTININKDIDLLGIPKGKISVQRLFYWYIFKCYYDKKFSFNEMHHINYDWYSPQNASTHTKEEVKKWCKKVNLSILNFEVDNAGISVIAKK